MSRPRNASIPYFFHTNCLSTFRDHWTWTTRSFSTSMLLRVLPLNLYFPLRFDLPKYNTSYKHGLNSICHFSAHFCSNLFPSLPHCLLLHQCSSGNSKHDDKEWNGRIRLLDAKKDYYIDKKLNYKPMLDFHNLPCFIMQRSQIDITDRYHC